MRVLIAGCGDLGTRAALRLIDDGHSVVGLRRDPSKLPGGIEPLAADLGGPLEPLRDFDAVVYAAAADGRTEEAYRRAYVTGLSEVLDALDPAPARILFVSSTGVYAQSDGEWVDHTSPAEATAFTGRIIREAEELLWSRDGEGVVVRLGGIYGPGRTALIDRVQRGEGIREETPPVHTNRIHVDDAAGLIAHVIQQPEVERLYLGVDDAPAPRSEVHGWLAERLGVELNGTSTPGRGGNKRVRRTPDSGYVFRYPDYRAGYAELLS